MFNDDLATNTAYKFQVWAPSKCFLCVYRCLFVLGPSLSAPGFVLGGSFLRCSWYHAALVIKPEPPKCTHLMYSSIWLQLAYTNLILWVLRQQVLTIWFLWNSEIHKCLEIYLNKNKGSVHNSSHPDPKRKRKEGLETGPLEEIIQIKLMRWNGFWDPSNMRRQWDPLEP